MVSDLIKEARRQVEAFLEGNLVVFNLPISPGGSVFQRKVYDQPGDWTFACFWTGGLLEIGPDPAWPYGACIFPWTEKNQMGKKGQDTDIPYGFHLYNYNNNNTNNDFSNSLILKITDLEDNEVEWNTLKETWYPKVFKMNTNLKRYIEKEYREN